MEQLIVLIFALVVIAVFLSAIVLPIVALVISVRSRNKINEKVSRLEGAQAPMPGGPQQPAGEVSLAQGLQQLNARVHRLEATLAAHSIFPGTVDERREPGSEVEETSEAREIREAREARSEPAPAPSITSPQSSGPDLFDVYPSVPERAQLQSCPTLPHCVRATHCARTRSNQ